MGLTTIRNVLNLIILCHIPVTTIDAFSTDVVPPTANFDRRIIRRRTKKVVATKVTTQTNTFVLFSSTTTDETVVSSYTSSPSSTKFSTAAEWHRDRRKEMIDKYGDKILTLERNSSSQNIGLPLLVITNFSLLSLSLFSGVNDLSIPEIFVLSVFPGSMLSLWQLQILHDCLHGSLFEKKKKKQKAPKIEQQKQLNSNSKSKSVVLNINRRKQLKDNVLFWGSMPSIFGYYLYLKYGHMTHHTNVGDPDRANLAKLFDSDQKNFEDGDVLFVSHRMKLKGEIGPTFQLPFFEGTPLPNKITMSISKSGFNQWKTTTMTQPGNLPWNVMMFTISFLFERFMLLLNDFVVAIAGRNFFFPNKPDSFHEECAEYARWASLVRATLLLIGGWKSLLFLFLSETLWSIPPHPSSAMFVSNHPSSIDEGTGDCVPSMSTYAGRWYSLFTLGTNYHCEHHDFPTIPFHKLHELRQIAPEFYRTGSDDDIIEVMKNSFTDPDFYACMDVHKNV
mmetsp:Transcript_2126/g.2429  ORF Transcript_2126/g.2429 Transcript_2126/m.2429 type:complete len:506 (+) Transcript_2126:59-1576(+)